MQTSARTQPTAEKQPNRYVRDEQGMWRCPPGEAFAAKYGLTYQVWSSDNINWAAQENALFLEDYYQHLDRLVVPESTLAILHRLVEKHPGISCLTFRRHLRDLLLISSILPLPGMTCTLIWQPTDFRSHGVRRYFARGTWREPLASQVIRATNELSHRNHFSCQYHCGRAGTA